MKHIGPISGIASYSDCYVATAGYDNVVILWDAISKLPLNRVFHDHLANQCAFSPDGTLLVSASSDYTARIWSVPDLRLRTVLVGHDDDLEMATFSPDQARVATCSRDHTIRIFDIEGPCLKVLRGHLADVISICWTPDGKELISSSDDGTVRRWDALAGSLIQTIDLGGIETDTLVISSDSTIFAGNDEGKISLLRQGKSATFSAHDAGIKRLVWDDRRRFLVSLSYDRQAIVWKADSDGKLVELKRTQLPSIIWPRSAAFLGEDQLVFATFGSHYASWNFMTDRWDTNNIVPDISVNAVASVDRFIYTIGDAGTLFKDGKKLADVGSLCNFLLPFGDSILTGGQMGAIFDGKTARLIHQHKSPLNCGTVFIKAGRPHAMVGTYTGEGLVFELNADGAPEYAGEVRLHENAVKGLASNSGFIFSVCATAAAAFHRIDDLSLDHHVPKAHDRISNGCASISGGFASVGRDLTLRLWRDGGMERYESPHRNSVKCVASSPGGRLVATGSYGGSVAIFDIETCQWISHTRPTAAGISSLCCSGEEGSVAFLASSYDGKVYHIAAA